MPKASAQRMNSAARAKPQRFMTLNWNGHARVRCNDLLGAQFTTFLQEPARLLPERPARQMIYSIHQKSSGAS